MGIPLAHRLPPGRLRTGYTLGLRTLGLGTQRDAPAREWTRSSLEWVDRYCFYRPYREIARTFGAYEIHASEADYCRFRARASPLRKLLSRWDWMLTILLRRLAFTALEMRRRPLS